MNLKGGSTTFVNPLPVRTLERLQAPADVTFTLEASPEPQKQLLCAVASSIAEIACECKMPVENAYPEASRKRRRMGEYQVRSGQTVLMAPWAVILSCLVGHSQLYKRFRNGRQGRFILFLHDRSRRLRLLGSMMKS
jgi:hypothetical protein